MTISEHEVVLAYGTGCDTGSGQYLLVDTANGSVVRKVASPAEGEGLRRKLNQEQTRLTPAQRLERQKQFNTAWRTPSDDGKKK